MRAKTGKREREKVVKRGREGVREGVREERDEKKKGREELHNKGQEKTAKFQTVCARRRVRCARCARCKWPRVLKLWEGKLGCAAGLSL